MSSPISALQAARTAYLPKLSEVLKSGAIRIDLGAPTEPASDRKAIKALFPQTYGQSVAHLVQGEGDLTTRKLKVGVVLSGGQAPGGHNVIAGLYDALKAANPESELYGYLKGPIGLIRDHKKRLSRDEIARYRNTGGFNMIRSGRDKIEKDADLEACKENIEALGLDGLVIIGGDDSNTNAALLAEYLKANNCKTVVVGVPKTIDGDMKNELIEASFGFDTACKTYSELIGNIGRDCLSAVKYWHIIRLMGRAASHVTLECALQTHPNICLVSEEIEAKQQTLNEVVEDIAHVVIERSNAKKPYGILLLPEGLIEFMPDMKAMIAELGKVLGEHEAVIEQLDGPAARVEYVIGKLSAENAKVYGSLPAGAQAVLLTRDKHGNVPLSQVETDRLIADLVSEHLKEHEIEEGEKYDFNPLTHFMGYEGRCAFPSNFDADYTYGLGYTAAQFVRGGLTGYTVFLGNLLAPAADWVPGGAPVTMMLNMEVRKGKPVPVIKKALVDLNGAPLGKFIAERDKWAMEDGYLSPGPIQYFGPTELVDQPTLTLQLERT